MARRVVEHHLTQPTIDDLIERLIEIRDAHPELRCRTVVTSVEPWPLGSWNSLLKFVDNRKVPQSSLAISWSEEQS